MKPRTNLRAFLMRWHRRLGVMAALFVVVLSITGIMLNHSPELALSERPLQSSWLLSVYGVETPEIQSYRLNGSWFSLVGNSHLHLNDREVAYCQGPLVGAVKVSDTVVVGCVDQLLLLSDRGEVIERIDAIYGLPLPLQALAVDDQQLVLKTNDQTLLADLDHLTFQPFTGGEPDWSIPAALPDELHEQLLGDYRGTAIHWERVVLDLHSGRLFGRLGIWVMDAAAVFLILLAGSGVWIWWSRGR